MNRFQPRHAVVVGVFALLALGIVMVTSAGLSIEPAHQITMVGILSSRTAIYAYLALIFMGIGSHLDLTAILNWHGDHQGEINQPATTQSTPLKSPSISHIAVPSISASNFPANSATDPTPPTPSTNEKIIQFIRAVAIHPATYLFLISIVMLLLVHLPGIGAIKNGAARWIEFKSGSFKLSMQPSEFAKWAMTIILPAGIVAMGPTRIRRFFTGFLPLLIILSIICVLIITEDLGTAVLIGTVGMIVLFAAGVRWWHIVILLPAPIATIIYAILSSSYRMDRWNSFWNPYIDAQDKGYHMIQSMSAIANGHLTGRGLGHGIFKFGYLPEDTTDFLFAIICEEMGIIGALLVLFLYVVLLISGFLIIKRIQNNATKLVALGIVLTVGLQAVINLMVVTGLAPTKGIALPLLSAGGTGWILTAFSLGLLIKMDRVAEQNEHQETTDPEPTSNEYSNEPTDNATNLLTDLATVS